MSKVTNIVAQRDARLISRREAWVALDGLARQSQFNATYADSPDSYKHHSRIALDARIAANRSLRP